MVTRMAAAREAAWTEAERFGGVLSRAMLRDLGIDRGGVARQVAARGWQLHGHQTVALQRGDLSEVATRWRAIWEVGSRIAILDGPSALHMAGLKHFTWDDVVVSIPHGSRPGKVCGVEVHQVRRRVDSEVITAGIPRATPAVAAVRAAHWAKSDRQAALVLSMAVQQRLVTGERIAEAARVVVGRRRRSLVQQLAADITNGAQSLGKLDFAALCRARGLPEPARQVVRQGPRGRVYLDVRWDKVGLVVEIDGAQHRQGLAVSDDNLRVNAVVIGGDMLLRIDLVGMRITPDLYLDQVCAAYEEQSRRAS